MPQSAGPGCMVLCDVVYILSETTAVRNWVCPSGMVVRVQSLDPGCVQTHRGTSTVFSNTCRTVHLAASPSMDLWKGWLHPFMLCISRSINLNLYILQRSIVWRDEHPLWEQRWRTLGDRGHRAQISPGNVNIITLGNRSDPRAISSHLLGFKGQGAAQLLPSFVSLRPWLPLLPLP